MTKRLPTTASAVDSAGAQVAAGDQTIPLFTVSAPAYSAGVFDLDLTGLVSGFAASASHNAVAYATDSGFNTVSRANDTAANAAYTAGSPSGYSIATSVSGLTLTISAKFNAPAAGSVLLANLRAKAGIGDFSVVP